MKQTKLGIFGLIILGVLVIPSLLPFAFASPTIEWAQGITPDSALEISSGKAFGLSVTVRVADDDIHTPGVVDTIDVAITSSVDGIGTTLTLTETETDTNFFQGENFVFLIDPSYQFLISDTVTIQVDGSPLDSHSPNCDTDDDPTELDGSLFGVTFSCL